MNMADTKLLIGTRIHIGPTTFKIKYDHLYLRGQGLLGETDHIKRAIILDDTVSADGLLGTFVHEVEHVIANNYGLAGDEEHIVRLANGTTELVQHLLRNWR